jgi:DNA polymerase III subunit alpha
VETYLRRRSGEEKISYLLPEIKKILSSTCGLILYQEQVMQIACEIAGYSMGEADSLRRALSKKSVDTLISHRERFLQGALQRGRSEEEASAVFDFLTRFAGYSFNKAHSISYAYLSYWTVYLKTHYPKEYMASLLSMEGGYYDKRVYLREITKLGISLLRPDVNRSGFGFQAEAGGIRVGMDQIKGSGPKAVASLLSSRQKDGQFTSLPDLVARMKAYRMKTPLLKAWIASGACDGLGKSRRQMMNSLNSSQISLFDNFSLDSVQDFSPDERRRMEKALFGFSLDQTPSKKWSQFLKQYQIVPIEALTNLENSTRVRISGTIIHTRRQPLGNGKYLLVLVLQDHSEMVEVILYPEVYKTFLYQLNPMGIMLEGILRAEDLTCQVIAEKIKDFGG